MSSVARSSNDHLIVSGSQGGTILMHTVSSSTAQQVVNLTKDQPLKQVSGHETMKTRKKLVFPLLSYQDKKISVAIIFFSFFFAQVVNRLNFSLMEKSHVGSVSDDGVVCLWSVESQRMLAKFSPSHAS